MLSDFNSPRGRGSNTVRKMDKQKMSNRVTQIAGDGRMREARLWRDWLGQVPEIRDKNLSFARAAGIEEFDPFYFNETSSVALLGNAAALAGFLVSTEYRAVKRGSGRGRPYRNGRVDLWLADLASVTSWAIEAKQHWAAPGMRKTTYDQWMEKAATDARSLHVQEADKGVGCVIIVPQEPVSPADTEETCYDEYCRDADFSYRVGGGLGVVWIAFKIRG